MAGRPAEEGAGEAPRHPGVRRERLQMPAPSGARGRTEGKTPNLLGIFLGTGIGGGIILEGELYRGFKWHRGRTGHMVIQVGGTQVRLRQQRLLRGAGQPHRHLPRHPATGEGRPEDDPHRMAGRRPVRTAQRRPAAQGDPQGDKLVEKVIGKPRNSPASQWPTSSTFSIPR